MTVTTSAPVFVHETYIRATPEKVWEAITRPEFTSRYFFHTSVEADWKAGSRITYRGAGGDEAIVGEVIEVVPNQRLVHTFDSRWGEAPFDAPSRVTWEITPMGETCKVSITHDRFDGETKTFHGVSDGWPKIAAGLKTMLETGEELTFPEM
ncbi:MAG: SRPBCC family protein [Candidatus Dormibacteria bacterium]